MGPYTFPRDNTHQLYRSQLHTAAGGEHINRATFIIGGKDRDPAPVGNHPGMFHVQHNM